jgi:hypothetical protein
MKRKNAILFLITMLLITIGEFVRHANPTLGWIFLIAALISIIFLAMSKDSKLKKSNLIIMIVIAVIFLLYPIFFT